MRSLRFHLVGAAGLAAFSTSAFAQVASNTGGGASAPAAPGAAGATVTEVVVTANKREERLLDVAQSVSVLTAETLQQEHAQRLDDIFTRVPSASIEEPQAGRARIILRGINTGGVASTVATYVDETPYGSATALVDGAVLTPDLDPNDLSRVEVLRGPQGTLYGANSLGGLVKYVTVLPTFDKLKGTAEVGVEDVDHGSTVWSGRGALNVPITDTLAARVSGFYRDDPGYIDDPGRGRNINDGETYGGRISLLYKPIDRLTLRGTASVEELRSHGTNAEDVDPTTLQPVYGDLTQKRVLEEPSNIEYQVYNGTGTYDFGPVSLLSSTSYGILNQNTVGDDSGLFTPLLASAFGTIGYGEVQAVRQRRFTEEVRLASTGHHFFDWTVGGYYSHESNRLYQNIGGVNFATGAPLPAFSNLGVLNEPSYYTEYAGFANATLHFTKQFDLSFGGRYSHNDQHTTEVTSGPLAGVGAFSSKSSDGVFTYSVAPSYKPTEDITLYARVAKGYRPGGPNIVPSTAPADVPRQFGSDTTTNYEAGIKSEFLNHTLSAELTGFYIDWEDIQLLTVVGNYGVNANGGSAQSAGVEGNFTYVPMKGLTLSANGAYIDAHLTEDTPAILGGRKGDRLPFTAHFASTVAIEYERPLTGTVNGEAGLSWRHTGSRESNFNATVGQLNLGGFEQLDAHAGVTFDRYRLDIYARNLSDARGIVDLGGPGSAQNGDFAASVIRPRSFGLTLSVRY